MKTDAEVAAEVERVDRNIDHVRAMLEQTDNTITTLTKLQQSRRDYLRKLSALRSELQTYELRLEA